jgi:HK97 family phage major capsid protein
VNSSYRQVGEWLAHDNTVATMRKLRSGGGGTLDNFLWSPSATAGLINGTPDLFLGRPIYASTDCASMASDARVVAFGDFSAYYARTVSPNLRIGRSTDLAFDKNQTAIRGLMRVDGGLADTTAINYLHQRSPDLTFW